MDSKNIYQHVQDHYGSIARAENSTYSHAIAKAFGYSEQELSTIPKDANLGLSCGNPLAIASLRDVRLFLSVMGPLSLLTFARRVRQSSTLAAALALMSFSQRSKWGPLAVLSALT